MDEKTATQIQDEYYTEMEKYFEDLAKELNCSYACAMDVWYLRQRSRHTPQLENELIAKYAAGEPVNICEFGN